MYVSNIDVLMFVLSMRTAVQLSSSPQDSMTSERCLKWDVQFNKCEECEVGYFGENCTMECRYPSYGKECQRECNCLRSYCSIISGCQAGSPTLSTKTPHSSKGFIPELTRASTPAINDCPLGYQGNNCSLQCRYPNYGIDCQSMCLCQKKHCNHATGCNLPYCRRNYPPETRNVLISSIIVLDVWAVTQFIIYVYFSFFYKT